MTRIQTPNIFAPVSTPALAIRDLSFIVLAITGAIFLIVAGFAVYTLIRFGRRPTNPEVEPAQVYGSTQIELAWTVVPLLIVVVLFLVTARYVYGIERRHQPPDALEITVVGNQWWWEIRYPKLGIVTANEIHVPVSDVANPAPTFITGTSGNGVFGPDLTHLMSRSTLGAGAVRNTRENLRAWVKDPAAFKVGALMPAMKLDDAQLDQLLAYLVTLR